MRNFKFSTGLDRDFLESVYEDDMVYAEEIFKSFSDALPAGLTELEEKYQQGIIAEFRSVVHRLKPTFSYAGLTGITEQLALLEKNCLEVKQLDELADLYRQILLQVELAVPVVKNELNRLKAYNQFEEKS